MILLIPNINLKNSKSSEIINGEIGTEEFYNNLSCNPEELIKLIRRENAKSVNIVDLDSYDINNLNNNYFDLEYDNNELANNNKNLLTIENLCRNTDIPIQLETNIKKSTDVDKILGLGVYRVSIKINSDLSNIEFIKFLLDDFGTNKISIVYELKKTKLHNGSILDLLKEFENYKNLRIIIDFDKIKYINLDELENLFIEIIEKGSFVKTKNIRFTIKNFIKNSKDLFSIKSFEKYNIDSLIIGNELNNNIFPCQKIWREIESKVEVLN